jgi:glycosyltransferase involved in cell wall biosynthesis
LGRLAALGSADRLSRRCVYTIHGFDTILKTHRRYLPLERILSNFCGAVVPVSQYDESNLRNVGIEKNVHLVLNGASDRRGMQSPDQAAVGQISAARTAGRKVVLCIARLEAPKRPDLFASLARSFPDLSFFWVGNVHAPLPSDLGGLEIPPNLKFLGESPEAGTLVNLCDIFVLLSDYEGIPMSVLEAMSCGKAIIASRVGGIPEALGEGGILVETTIGAIGAATNALLSRPGLAKSLGDSARKRYEAGYSAEQMWDSYRNLYTRLL